MNFKIYDEFSPQLQKLWQNLYKKAGKAYCTSYEWCFSWFKYFGHNKKLFIITGWIEDEMQLIAPFYTKDGKLYLIGSYPDFYDKFQILCTEQELLPEVADFIIEHKFELNLRLIFPEDNFLKYLLKRMEHENIYKTRVYGYTVKPLIYNTEEMRASLKKKYKRIKKKETLAQREFNDELQYDIAPLKSEKYIEEFMDLHEKKWNTFKTARTRNFIKNLYLNQDFVLLSRMYLKNSDKSIAYSFKYKSPDNVLYDNMFSYNPDYARVSPGFLATYYDLSSDIAQDIEYIDYGTGSFEYKYFFANKEEIFLNIKADLCWKQHKLIYYPLKTMKNKLASMF